MTVTLYFQNSGTLVTAQLCSVLILHHSDHCSGLLCTCHESVEPPTSSLLRPQRSTGLWWQAGPVSSWTQPANRLTPLPPSALKYYYFPPHSTFESRLRVLLLHGLTNRLNQRCWLVFLPLQFHKKSRKPWSLICSLEHGDQNAHFPVLFCGPLLCSSFICNIVITVVPAASPTSSPSRSQPSTGV